MTKRKTLFQKAVRKVSPSPVPFSYPYPVLIFKVGWLKVTIYVLSRIIFGKYTNSWGKLLMPRSLLWLRTIGNLLKHIALICPRVNTVFEGIIIDAKLLLIECLHNLKSTYTYTLFSFPFAALAAETVVLSSNVPYPNFRGSSFEHDVDFA